MNKNVVEAYLRGALGDATYNRLHKTWRYSQKEKEWLGKLKELFSFLSIKSWIYQEGKTRNVHVLETTAKFLSEEWRPNSDLEEKATYVRGYFDAEGGVPQKISARFYIQLVQKDYEDLLQVKKILEELNIRTGILHNPSHKVDPNYWRFFVRASSYRDFVEKVGSWHPRKSLIFQDRMKI